MPTIITHAVVPLALAVAMARKRISPNIAIAGIVLSVLPDADVAGFVLGLDYAAEWGHRGASHSLALTVIVVGGLCLCWRAARSVAAAAFLAFAMASHGLLDMATDGGLGVALLWPVDDARHFWPLTPVRVSPIGAGFFSARGVETLLSELKWIIVPSLLVGFGWRTIRERQRGTL
jgi:inner membrane protein